MIPSAVIPYPGSYESIGWLVVGLASLCVAINQIDDFFERRKPKVGFPPVEQLESSHEALARRVEKLEESLGEIRREMKEDRLQQHESATVRAAGIYRKIEDVRSELTMNLEKVRAELSANQRSLPNEIVALLKNTNAI